MDSTITIVTYREKNATTTSAYYYISISRQTARRQLPKNASAARALDKALFIKDTCEMDSLAQAC
jgi:hypothetical protein